MRRSAPSLLLLVFGGSCAKNLRTPGLPVPEPVLSETPDVFDTDSTKPGNRAAYEAMRYAIRWGAPADSLSSVDLAPAAEEIWNGNLVRVDLWKGDVTSLAHGVAFDARCSPGVRLPSEVVFLCKGELNVGDFILSHTVDGRTIRSDVGPSPLRPPYSVSDDSGMTVAFGASPCRPKPSGPPVPRDHDNIAPERLEYAKCVRAADGSGHLYFIEAARAGGPVRFEPVRWVPRGDGAVALVVNAVDGKPESWGVVDGVTHELHRWAATPDADIRAALMRSTVWGSCRVGDEDTWLDRDWSLTAAGSLLGWIRAGDRLGRVEILPDGSVHRAPQLFVRILPSGPVALGQTADGHVLQTLDHGVTWKEVPTSPGELPSPEPLQCAPLALAAPEPPKPPCDVSGKWCSKPHDAEDPPPLPPPPMCSLVGCDLGGSIRVGWSPNPGARGNP